jgi:pimeloyl-ACP methyl ester carboxylesterase
MSVFGGTQASPPTNAIPTSQRILRALPTPMLKVANSSFMSATSTSITTSLPKNPRRSKRRSTGQNSATPTNRRPSVSIDQENLDVATADNKDVPAGMRAGAASGLSHRQSSQPLGDSRQSGDGATVLDTMTEQERQSTYDMRLTHAIWQLATTGANPAVDLLICLERRHTIGFRYVDINRPVIIHHGSRDTRVPVDNVRWLGKTMRRCEVRVLEGEGHGLMASATVMGAVLMEISKEWEDWMRATGADGRKDRERGRSRTIGR